MAAFALHVVVRAELAVSSARSVARWRRIVPGMLAAARAAANFGKSRAGRPHDDLRRDFYFARSTDSFDWSVRESFWLLRTIRSRNGFAEAGVEARDAGDGITAGRCARADGICGLRVDYLGLGRKWFWRIAGSTRRTILVHVAAFGNADYFFVVLLEHAG